MGMSFSENYSLLYDLLYQDKNYMVEVEYVDRTIQRYKQEEIRSILEIGSGTGLHALGLKALGYDLTCVEPSIHMATQARSRGLHVVNSDFDGIKHQSLGKSFDCVIAMFHVMSYALVNSNLDELLLRARQALREGGLFIFDVWHGPAVENLGMELRVKKVESNVGDLVRISTPELDLKGKIGRVSYDIFWRKHGDLSYARFEEEHTLRYVFPSEVREAALNSGFEILRMEEFLAGNELTSETWGASYILKKGSE
jgi:SAM-dependent methyltransferase